MQNTRRFGGKIVAAAREAAFDIEHTAQISHNHDRRGGGGDGAAFAGGDGGGNLAELDRESAAETAALLAFGRFAQRPTGGGEQTARLFFNPQFAQTRATIVISGDFFGILRRRRKS